MPTEIRLATIDDAAEIQAIYEPIVLETAVSFELVPPTVEEFQERITRTLEKTPWLTCEIDGAVAGCTYAGQHRAREAYQGSVEVTVCLTHCTIGEEWAKQSTRRCSHVCASRDTGALTEALCSPMRPT